VESHASRLEQLEDKISEFEDKIEIKEKKRRNLNQTTQEL
jgi:TolA-binding protein